MNFFYDIFAIALSMTMTLRSYGFDLEEYISKTSKQTDTIFLSQFPYEDYLEQIEIRNIQNLEKHRALLNHHGRNGDSFLIRLFETYLKIGSFDINDIDGLKRQLTIAEAALNFRVKADTVGNSTYEIIGQLLFDKVASVVQEGINQGRLNKKSKEVRYLISWLDERQYIIDIPVSDFEKLIFYIKKGNWEYLYERIKKGYLWQFIGFVALVSLVFFVVVYIAFKKLKNRNVQRNH